MSFFDWPLASAFYFLQGSTLLALWLAVRLGSGVDFFQLSEKLSNTALIPSWMPRRIFLLLVSKEVYRVAAYSTIPWFFLAAWVESSGYNLWVRGGCSIAVTLFQLGDSCRTTSHRDYLMIYISWALLVSSDFAETAAYGLCVLYILGSGLSKLRIGGWRWSSPETLRSILETFARKTPKQGGCLASVDDCPILAVANRFVRKHDKICGSLRFERRRRVDSEMISEWPWLHRSSLMWSQFLGGAAWAVALTRQTVPTTCHCHCECASDPCPQGSWLWEGCKALIFIGIGLLAFVIKSVWAIGQSAKPLLEKLVTQSDPPETREASAANSSDRQTSSVNDSVEDRARGQLEALRKRQR
eukprot:s382_g5.t1